MYVTSELIITEFQVLGVDLLQYLRKRVCVIDCITETTGHIYEREREREKERSLTHLEDSANSCP